MCAACVLLGFVFVFVKRSSKSKAPDMMKFCHTHKPPKQWLLRFHFKFIFLLSLPLSFSFTLSYFVIRVSGILIHRCLTYCSKFERRERSKKKHTHTHTHTQTHTRTRAHPRWDSNQFSLKMPWCLNMNGRFIDVHMSIVMDVLSTSERDRE